MPISADAFRQTLARFASGVTIVTVAHNGELSGLTVSAFSSVSLDPPYILICVDKSSSSNGLIQAAGAFAVNILSSEQSTLSNHFAKRQDDKFQTVPYHIGHYGMPILEDTLAQMECNVVQTVDAGDHYIYIGQVETSNTDESKEPLLYYSGKYRELNS